MKKLALGALFAAIAVTGCSDSKKTVMPADDTPDIDAAPADMDVVAACNPLTHAGCNANEKCAWVTDSTSPAIGHLACEPDGTVAVGAHCTRGAAGPMGYDDCTKGGYCIGPAATAKCEAVCNPSGGDPKCAANFGCVLYTGLYEDADGNNQAGVCEPSCNPLNDVDYDDSGPKTRRGSACGSAGDTTSGCYGFLSDGSTGGATAPTHFSCGNAADTTGDTVGGIKGFDSFTFVHRHPDPSDSAAQPGLGGGFTNGIPSGFGFLNTCHPGYQLTRLKLDEAGAEFKCIAWCKPGDAYLNNPQPQKPAGIAGDACGSVDRTGAFGAIASATNKDTNGEHCVYSWFIETTDATHYLKSDTSDTLGFCWDHTKVNFIDTNNDNMADAKAPNCIGLPLKDDVMFDSGNVGCVSTTLYGLTPAADGKTLVNTHQTEAKRRMMMRIIESMPHSLNVKKYDNKH